MKRNMLFYGIIAIAIVATSYIIISNVMNANSNHSLSIKTYYTNVSDLYPFNTTRFLILINNTGKNNINDLLVGFYLNNKPLHMYNVSIPTGETAPIRINYTFKTTGTHDFKVVADPANVLDLNTRNSTQSIIVNVKNASITNPFSQLPNGTIVSSYNFSLAGDSLPVIAELNNYYKIDIFDSMTPINKNVLSKIFIDSTGTIQYSYGAYAKYKSGAQAQAVFLQGTVNPSFINSIIESFNPDKLSFNGTTAFMLNNRTSICVSSKSGFTSILFYNSTNNSNCISLKENSISNYSQPQGNLSRYTQEFVYINSTRLGNIFGSNNKSVYLVNEFQNKYGVFFSSINKTEITQPGKNICYGVISNNSNVCSIYLKPSYNYTGNYGVVDSEELAGNYILNVYSIVNTSELQNSAYNSANLLSRLNLSEKPLLWYGPYQNSCNIRTAAMSCNVTTSYTSNNTASVKLFNLLNQSIRINYLSCFVPGLRKNQTINETIPPDSYANVSVLCQNIPEIILPINSYNLSINYNLGNHSYNATGIMNLTNT
jgi:hypothetical protein